MVEKCCISIIARVNHLLLRNIAAMKLYANTGMNLHLLFIKMVQVHFIKMPMRAIITETRTRLQKKILSDGMTILFVVPERGRALVVAG